jgi:hypothetical protein
MKMKKLFGIMVVFIFAKLCGKNYLVSQITYIFCTDLTYYFVSNLSFVKFKIKCFFHLTRLLFIYFTHKNSSHINFN